jgi:hypothetical protein
MNKLILLLFLNMKNIKKMKLFIIFNMNLISKKNSFNFIFLLSRMLALNEFQSSDFIKLEKEI